MTPTRCTGKACTDGPLLDDQPAPRLAEHGTMLCRRCTGHLEQHLAETGARVDQLRTALTGATGHGGSRRGTPEPPVPLNLAAHDHLGHLAAVLASWASLVREERGLRGPDGDDPKRLATWLQGQLDWLVEQPWVDDLAEELREVADKADAITGRRRLRHRLEPACPRCGARELGRDDGSERVDCASCGSSWDEKHYPALVRLALDDSQGCLTAEQAAERLETTVGAFRQRVHLGQVRKLGTVDGQARYSAADVEALISDERESA